MFPDLTEVDFVVEVESKEARVVVCTFSSFAVFAARVVAEGTFTLTESLEKASQVIFLQTSVLGKVVVIVR